MAQIVKVDSLPQCDICGAVAQYDAKTVFGSWGNLCENDFQQYGLGQLGTGYGQKLVIK